MFNDRTVTTALDSSRDPKHGRADTSSVLQPAKLQAGDRVAVLSPSLGLAARYPERFELGLRRLRKLFDLVPVEYPTTRAAEATPADKAADLMAAFADPKIAAIWATSGGMDELKILAHLDPERIRDSPKAFIGYSDNTNLNLYLHSLGLASFHGPLVMFQLAFADGVDSVTLDSLRRALFIGGEYDVPGASMRIDEGIDPWLTHRDALQGGLEEPSEWTWSGPATRVAGSAWGGSLEVVDFHLRTGRYLLPNDAYRGAVGYFETSQELPGPDFVSRVLTCMGERGLLSQFGAFMWGQPASASTGGDRPAPALRKGYVEAQRDVVLAVIAEYNPAAPIVFGVDFGHTRPQVVIPAGGTVVVDGEQKRVVFHY